MNRLARREHSRFELAQKLQTAGFEPEIVEQTLDSLVQEGLVDDHRFVEAFVNARKRRGKGPLFIQAELRHKGVEDEIVQQALRALADEWGPSARAQREKKYGADAPADLKERARQSRFLAQRGFTGEHIRGAFDPAGD